LVQCKKTIRDELSGLSWEKGTPEKIRRPLNKAGVNQKVSHIFNEREVIEATTFFRFYVYNYN
jgi:hypothetical protein